MWPVAKPPIIKSLYKHSVEQGNLEEKIYFQEFIIFYLTTEHFSLQFFLLDGTSMASQKCEVDFRQKKDVIANPFPSILIISVKCPPDCHRMMLPSSSDDTIRPPCASSSQMAVLCEVSVSCSLTAVPRGGMSNTMIPPSEVPKITNLLGVTNLSKHTYVDRELHVHHHMWVKILKGKTLLKHWRFSARWAILYADTSHMPTPLYEVHPLKADTSCKGR